MGNDSILKNLVRVGVVSSINPEKRMARVTFPQLNDMVSGELYVLQHIGTPVSVEANGHTHGAELKTWMPNVGQTVLCLYAPIEDGDGYILGGV